MRLIILIVFVLLSLFATRGESQSNDAFRLQEQLKSAQGITKIDILNQLSLQLKSNSPKLARKYALDAYNLSKTQNYTSGLASSAYYLGAYEKDSKRISKAIRLIEEGINAAKAAKQPTLELTGLGILASIYQMENKKKKLAETQLAYKKIEGTLALEELQQEYDSTETALNLAERENSLINAEKNKIQTELNLTQEEKLQQEAELALLAQEKAELELKTLQLENEAVKNALEISEKEKEILAYDARLRRQQFFQILLITGLFATLLILALWYRNYQLKKSKAAEKAKLQRQLFVQEKMATLGQLTAGIAHEIKNPLNFVNNFAEGTTHLTEELVEVLTANKEVLKKDQFELVEEITGELKQNALDIIHHGKRADQIVKSMMEHARGGEGLPQLTDINQLLEDNVNLAYHGYRALNPSFDVEIEKDLDTTISQIQVISQDLNRVFINILNNACYAINQKLKKQKEGYTPLLKVSTQIVKEQLEIRIRDNGNGIPEEIKDQIFNPFFTTKPAGDGNTGLGLSICYDIIVQGHEGQLKVNSEAGKFTEFIIQIPVKI